MKFAGLTMTVALPVICVSFAAMAAFAQGQTAQAAPASASDLTRYVPQGTEVFLCINLQRLTANPSFSKIYQRFETAQMNAGISAIQQYCGVNLLEDIQTFALAGEFKPNGKGVIFLKGKWQKDRLVTLVQYNPSYKARESSGFTIHSWQDEGSGKMNNAVFLQDDVLALSQYPEVLDLVIQAAAGTAPASPVKNVIGADAAAADAFVAAVRPSESGADILNNPVLSHLQNAFITLKATENAVSLAAKGAADDPRNAALLDPVLRGFLAFGELIQGTANAAPAPWTVNTKHEGAQIDATVEAPLDSVVGIVQLLKGAAGKPADSPK